MSLSSIFVWLSNSSAHDGKTEIKHSNLIDLAQFHGQDNHNVSIDLPRVNALLQLLHTVLDGFADEPASPQALIPLLKETEKLLNAHCSAILTRHGFEDYELLASTRPEYQAALIKIVNRHNKELKFSQHNLVKIIDDPDDTGFRYTIVQLHSNTIKGDHLLIIKRKIDKELTANELTLLKTVGDGFASILGCAHKAQANRRIALYEERAVIARELHDSLAQSLSYLKIQTSRLQKVIYKNSDGHELDTDSIDAVLSELRTNINLAYAQLRELITTFRLTMNGRTLKQALKDSAEEFENKSIVAITLDNRLSDGVLTVEEEMHVLQIIRECLSNIVRHALASHAVVYLYSDDTGKVTLIVDDDGIGIDEKRPPEQHQGLRIMQQRARSLGGELGITKSPMGGTRMKTSFATRANRNATFDSCTSSKQNS